jgi:hypothetical protein
VGVVQRYIAFVLSCGASLRCAASVLSLLATAAGDERGTPDRSTGRMWLLRLGLAALLRPKTHARDWVWMVDHSVQIGRCKCLVILGVRLSDLPEDRPLAHHDMEPIALVPMSNATQETVAARLEEVVAATGVPRLILTDHGADLHGGSERFRRNHPETSEGYDVKHKAACLLKRRLEKDTRWGTYATQLGQTKFAVQQTELAFLTPPSQRSKARFMNLGTLVAWGNTTLSLLDDLSWPERFGVSAERVESKLGWLKSYRAELALWESYQELIDRTLEFVRRRGYYVGAGFDLARELPEAHGQTGELREELIAFVREESLQVPLGERWPGTTEVLESCFGKLKALEDGQSKSGFTGLVLSLGAMVSSWTTERVSEALERCRVRDVSAWIRRQLGETLQSQRNRALGCLPGATELGQIKT